MTTIDVFAHEVCDGSGRDEDARWIFLPGSLLTRKKFTLNLVRTESPTHTEVRVIPVFVKDEHELHGLHECIIFNTENTESMIVGSGRKKQERTLFDVCGSFRALVLSVMPLSLRTSS